MKEKKYLKLFKEILLCVFNNIKVFIFIFGLLNILLLIYIIYSKYFIIIYFQLKFFVIAINFFFSFVLHEYMHATYLSMKNINFKIEKDLLKFSIIPIEEHSSKDMVLCGAVGPVIPFLLGTIVYVFSNFIDNFLLKMVSFVYIFHIIYILPIFGDGKAIIKGIGLYIINKKDN